jgi:hypothetical protein
VRVRLSTLLFGRNYLELFKRSVQSLTWPKNRAALDGAVWSVHTDLGEKVMEILGPLGFEVEINQVEAVSQKATGKLQLQTLISDLEKCVGGDALLTAQPDTIFGEGTIQTLVDLGSEGSNAISVSHPRVSDTFPELLEPTSNAQLVKLAFEHLHPSWREANMRADENNVFMGGVGWRKVGDLYAVTVRIPTPYFVRPKSEDIEVLKTCRDGGWDHVWPSFLAESQRHRLIGSSDAAFMVELTSPERRGALTRAARLDIPDAYKFNLEHHKINRNSLVIWRAER